MVKFSDNLKYYGRIDHFEDLEKLSKTSSCGDFVLNMSDNSMYMFDGKDWIKDIWDQYDYSCSNYENSLSENKNNVAKAKLVSYILKNGYNEELGQILESL